MPQILFEAFLKIKMEALLSELQKLSSSKRVIQPEQAILQHLIQFDLLFPNISSESDFRQLEKGLFGLFKINNGNFSVQCSISIAFRLTKIYNKMKEPPVASDISDLLNKLTQSSTIVIGEIFNRSGSNCISQIPKAINALISLSDELRFHSLFALRGIFKTKSNSLTQFCAPVFKYLRKNVDNIPEANQIIALKLMKAILEFDKNYFSSAIECCDACLLKNQTPFVRFQASKLAAYCALMQSNNGLKSSFSIIKKYSTYLSPIISQFLEILPISVTIQNSAELFQLIREISPNDVRFLLSYLTPSDKQTMFGTVLSETKPSSSQLSVLNLLRTDDGDILSCVSAALQLGRSNDTKDIESSRFFFSKLACERPTISQKVIESALMQLSQIKSEDIAKSNSVAVSAILENNQELLSAVKKPVEDYVASISSISKFASPRFSAFWDILSNVTDDLLDQKKLDAPLRGSCEALLPASSQGQQAQNQSPLEPKLATLMESLLRFFAKHPNFPHADLAYNAAQNQLNHLSEMSLANLVDYVIAVRRNSDNLVDFISQKILSFYPGREYLKKQIKRNFITGEDLLAPKFDEIETSRQIGTQRLIESFPKLIKCCQNVRCEDVINNLVSQSSTSQQMLVGHTLLLKIIEDEELSQNVTKPFIGNILKTLKGSDFFRIQITCELVSKAIEKQLAMMDALFRFIEMNKRAVSCLLISALMCRFHLSDSLLSRSILFIDERIFSHFSAPFALHALSTAMITQAETVNKLGIAFQHSNILLKLIHDTTSLHPVIIHLISTTFVDLLPIIQNNIDPSPKNATVLDILSLIESIRSTPYCFAKGVYYFASSCLSRTSIQTAFMIPIEFPKSKSAPFSLLLAASEAYSMIGRETVTSQIPRLLLAIEKANSPVQLTSVAQLLSRENGQFLLELIKSVLVEDRISFGTNTDELKPSNNVKYVVLQSLGAVFNTVTINEAPVIAVALCKAASSGVLELQTTAFPMLSGLLTRFTFSNLQPHFAALMPIAFKLSFSVSGGFLVSFMNKENLQLCFESLSKCMNEQSQMSETPEFIMMFTRALKISRESYDKNVPEYVKKYVHLIKPKLASITGQVLKSTDSYSSIASSYQSIWCDVWQSLIYSDFIAGNAPTYDPNFLMSFFIVQLRKSGIEEWIARGFIYGAAALVQFYPPKKGDSDEAELVKEVIDACISLLIAATNKDLIEEPVAQLCKYAARFLKVESVDSIWQNILYILMNSDFDPEMAALCIEHFDSSELEKRVFDITQSLLTRVALKDAEKCIALFIVLISKDVSVDTIINSLIDWSEKTPNSSVFAFRLLTILIKRKAKDSLQFDYDKIADFALKRFRRGGINFVANLMSAVPEVGVQLAIRGPTAAAAVLVVSDPKNAEIYIKFLMVCTRKINNKKLSLIMLDVAMKTLTHANVPLQLAVTCAQIFKLEQKDYPDDFKLFWEAQEEGNRELCVRNILSASS